MYVSVPKVARECASTMYRLFDLHAVFGGLRRAGVTLQCRSQTLEWTARGDCEIIGWNTEGTKSIVHGAVM
jgi:hypothetical protein